MTGYSVPPRDRIFVKGYGFLSFAKNMGKNVGRNISKNLSGIYSQKLLDQIKFKTLMIVLNLCRSNVYTPFNRIGEGADDDAK